jgi:hypothetical protein
VATGAKLNPESPETIPENAGDCDHCVHRRGVGKFYSSVILLKIGCRREVTGGLCLSIGVARYRHQFWPLSPSVAGSTKFKLAQVLAR